ncbi:MAG: hypothetical protein MJB57_07565 [Gemmatimonadetes bacterium]|nr:hypothetical protein [Gemmatimonadota bacterium]
MKRPADAKRPGDAARREAAAPDAARDAHRSPKRPTIALATAEARASTAEEATTPGESLPLAFVALELESLSCRMVFLLLVWGLYETASDRRLCGRREVVGTVSGVRSLTTGACRNRLHGMSVA